MPGPIVTNADGVVRRSNHQLHADGCGHAVDCTFLGANGKPQWVDSDPWAVYGACAKLLGLVWGGDWHSIQDRPHIELPDGVPQTGAGHVKADP
jgi:peptidoglycan L-alanyl-D-glutamate endopeptidase CwlK